MIHNTTTNPTACWVLLPPPVTVPVDLEEPWDGWHHETEAEARHALRTLQADTGNHPTPGKLTVHQLAEPCVMVRCTQCRQLLTEAGGTHGTHFSSVREALESARAEGWTRDLLCPSHVEWGVRLMDPTGPMADETAPCVLEGIARTVAMETGGRLVRRIGDGPWQPLVDLLAFEHGATVTLTGVVSSMATVVDDGNAGDRGQGCLDVGDSYPEIRLASNVYGACRDLLSKGERVMVSGVVNRQDPQHPCLAVLQVDLATTTQ